MRKQRGAGVSSRFGCHPFFLAPERFLSGAPARTRTWDQLIKSQLLYQLSYRGSQSLLERLHRVRRLVTRRRCFLQDLLDSLSEHRGQPPGNPPTPRKGQHRNKPVSGWQVENRPALKRAHG